MSKFVTKKWIKVNDLSSGKNSVDKQVVNILSTKRLKTSMLRSYLCDNSDAYIVVNGTIDLLAAAANENDKPEEMLHLKITLHLDHAFQKLRVHWHTMQILI